MRYEGIPYRRLKVQDDFEKGEDMSGATIPLTRGLFALVDKADYEYLSQWKWSALRAGEGRFYAWRGVGTKPNMKYFLMHREIMGVSGEDRTVEVDHINRNTLDNRRRNLRLATSAQNKMNQKLRSDNKIGFKGVAKLPSGRYRAVSRKKHLGCFDTPEEAYEAFRTHALREYGEFAYLPEKENENMAGLTFQAKEKEYKRILGGSHFAVCDMVVDVGLQETFFGTKQQVYLRFEVPQERWEYEKDGKKMEGPGVIGNFYTASMSAKANLRKFLEGWRGKKFTEAEASTFDIGSVLGKACLLNIQESTKGDKTYSNIVSAAPIMKGMEPPKAELPLLLYYPGKEEMFSQLPEWIRKKIENQVPAPDADEIPSYDRSNADITDDDIPF